MKLFLLALTIGVLVSFTACGGGTTTTTKTPPPPATFTISASVTGLSSGASVVLQNNGGNNLTVSANRRRRFRGLRHEWRSLCSLHLDAANRRDVLAREQQHGDGDGERDGGSDLRFTISVSVTGLSAGTTLVLQDNGGDNLSVIANGTFPFATPVNGTYAVTVLTQPAGESCSLGKQQLGKCDGGCHGYSHVRSDRWQFHDLRYCDGNHERELGVAG